MRNYIIRLESKLNHKIRLKRKVYNLKINYLQHSFRTLSTYTTSALKMDLNNPQNQSYWFVLREDQSNVYNFTIHNHNTPSVSGQETRYLVDTGDNRQYIHINETPVAVAEATIPNCDRETDKAKEEENFWDRDKIKLLLTLCLDSRFKNAFKDKTLWSEIATLVGVSSEECHRKYRNLKKTYIRLLKKKKLGKHIKWVHFSICEEVFKEYNSLPLSVLEPWDDTKVKQLLSLYLENLNRFRNPYCVQKDVWKDIAVFLGTTEYNCYHKFKNLKRTYLKWLERNNETGKLIKWPYHSYFEKIYYNYKPASGTWDRDKVNRLIQAYLQIAHKFKNPKFLKKELWKEISAIVGENPIKCDKKFRNLKQTYIRLKMRANLGRSVTKWCYYKDFEAIYGNSSFHSSDSQAVSKEENYIVQLLSFYLENKEKFRDRLMKKKYLWRAIGSKLGLTSEECHRKFRNLKQTYIRLKLKKATGICNKWPYYSYFEKIYDEQKLPQSYCNHEDHTIMFEVKKALKCMQKRDNDKFEKLVRVAEESNHIQRERNIILKALLKRK